MKVAMMLSMAFVLLFTFTGCVTSTIDSWTITGVGLVEGYGGQEDAPSCKNVDRVQGNGDLTGLFMWQFSNTRPSQPAGGDWMETSSDYTGYLFNQSGSGEYHCATARVTVERNPNVAPNVNFDAGQFIQLYVVAPHLCNEEGMTHPGEDRRQALAYAKEISQSNQTTVVFDQVIVASTCGGGLYTDNYTEGYEVNFGRWPSPDVNGALIKQGQTNSVDCVFIIGFNNFQGCP